jgi:hypothetical protein
MEADGVPALGLALLVGQRDQALVDQAAIRAPGALAT